MVIWVIYVIGGGTLCVAIKVINDIEIIDCVVLFAPM
jgi:hypothetical protein